MKIDWDIHVANAILELLVPSVLAVLLFFPLRLWYRGKNITGYFRDIRESTGKPGTALIKISFKFPNRLEIFAIESNGVAWIGENYAFKNGDLFGKYDWNIFAREGKEKVANYGEHAIHILPNCSPLRMHVVATKKSGGSARYESTWEKCNLWEL
jgi:hypothetical protein